VELSPEDLQFHPILMKYGIRPSTKRLSEIARSRDPSNLDPISITCEKEVMKGLEELEYARRMRFEKVQCLEYDLDPEEQIHWILDHNRKVDGLNDPYRLLLSRELMPRFRERGNRNMQLGGELKGSMNLSSHERIDCRGMRADAADVAEVQVDKFDRVFELGNAKLLEALLGDEVSIHRASLWARKPGTISDELDRHRTLRGTTKEVHRQLRKHQSKRQAFDWQPDVREIGHALAEMSEEYQSKVLVRTIRSPGKFVFISEEVRQDMRTQRKFSYEQHSKPIEASSEIGPSELESSG